MKCGLVFFKEKWLALLGEKRNRNFLFTRTSEEKEEELHGKLGSIQVGHFHSGVFYQ